MRPFLWNIFLAGIWAAARGDFTLKNLVIGLVLGYGLLWVTRDLIGAARYCAKVPRIFEFFAFFLWELLLANLRVAWDVITPMHSMRPGIIAMPLDAETDGQITLLANIISLTPGSLSLDVSRDRKHLYIHVQNLKDAEHEKQRIKQGLERRLLGVIR